MLKNFKAICRPGVFLLGLLLLSIIVPVHGNPQAIQGERCYETLFDAKAVGHNLVNAYLLIYVCNYTYENRIGAANFLDFKKKFQEIFLPLGLKRFDFINVREKTADTQAVIASNDKIVIVSFRGSEASVNKKVSPVKIVYDWIMTDFNFFRKRIPWWGSKVQVHRGFYTAMDVAYDELKKLVDSHMSGTPKALWITGHSLGAGIAPMAAFRLAGDGVSIQGLYTFAGPRIGNDAFVKAFRKRLPDMQRWVLDNDIVTKIPFKIFKYKHLCAPNNIYSNGKLTLQDSEMQGPGKVSNHVPGMYLQKMFDLLPLDIKDKVPLPSAFGSDQGVVDSELERDFNGKQIREEDSAN